MKYLIILFITILSFSVQSSELTSKSPKDASVFIISPKQGEVVKSPLTIKFGISGMQVSPAGIDKKNTGHHHLLVDGKHLPNLKIPLGSDVTHFGKGQTETTIKLKKGKHTLQLILGNYLHVPHDPAVISKVITIEVEN